MKNNYLDKLNTPDIYTFLLFAIYKLSDDPQYSTLSEMVYLLDKKSVLRLLEYYGGATIKIPTISELEKLINVLIIYQSIKFENKTFDEVFQSLKLDSSDIVETKKLYERLSELLEDYNFNV